MRTERPAGHLPRRFGRDADGAAVVEFAMVVPVLILLYLGTVDLSLGFTIHRKMQHATSAMSDLVSRENAVTKADLEAIFDMGDATVAPRAAKLDGSKISSISIDNAGKATIAWSRARNMAVDTVGSSVALPSDLASLRNASLIYTAAAYTFRPMGGAGLAGSFPMRNEVYGMPRIGAGITCSDCGS